MLSCLGSYVKSVSEVDVREGGDNPSRGGKHFFVEPAFSERERMYVLKEELVFPLLIRESSLAECKQFVL